MDAPHEPPANVSSPEAASPEASSPRSLALEVTEQLQDLSVQYQLSESQEEIVQHVPVSTKSFKFPHRPGSGSIGTRCLVKANHFFAQLPDKDLHQYDVRLFFHATFLLAPPTCFSISQFLFATLWFIFDRFQSPRSLHHEFGAVL
jgi:hypothetical protein